MTNYIIHNKNDLKQRLNKFEEGGNTIWDYALNSIPIGATYKVGDLIGNKIKKEFAYNILSQSSTPNRNIPELIAGMVADGRGNYKGFIDNYGIVNNTNKDIIKEYLFGNGEGNLTPMPQNEIRGFTYDDYINRTMSPEQKQNFKWYKEPLVPIAEGESLPFPKYVEPLINDLTKNKVGLYIEDPLKEDSSIYQGKNENITTVDTGNFRYNFGNYKVKDSKGNYIEKPEINYTDIYDFEPTDYKRLWTNNGTFDDYITNLFLGELHSMGQPLGFRQNVPIEYVNTDTPNVKNEQALINVNNLYEDLKKRNLLKKIGKDTYEQVVPLFNGKLTIGNKSQLLNNYEDFDENNNESYTNIFQDSNLIHNNNAEGGIIDNNEQYNRPPYDPKTLIFEDMYTHQNVGLQGLMKSTLANQATLFNNPTAKRILGYDNKQYVAKPNEISEEGGEVGNVYLGSYGEYVSPGFQEDENHNLHYVPSENMWDDAHENNTLKQSFKFRNPEEAEYFAEHYKEVSPYSMTDNDEYSPIKKLFDNDEDNYSKGGSIRERAKEIRLKVAEKFKPVYDYLYNEDTEDNQYKRGGRVRRNTGESAFDRDVNTTLALDKYKKYNTPEWRAFLKSIAYQESSFRPNAKSIAGAIGFYQLMPYENLSHLTEAQKKSGNWNQTALMLDHIEQVQKDIHNRLNYATLQKAKMMGLNDYDLLAIAHFSGVGGLRKWLRHSSPNNFKEGAKDGYGMSQFGYLKKFRKGMAKYSNNPEKETITPFPTESPTFDYEKYTEAILNQGLARLNAQYSQNYQDLPTYGPTKQSENPFEIKQLQDNFSSPFPLPNQLTQQPIQSAFGGIINRDNPIENYSNNPNIGLPTVRY